MAALSAPNPSAPASNEPPSPPTFTTIAPEIRNRIYELALTTDNTDTDALTTDDADTDSFTIYEFEDEVFPDYDGADTEVHLLEAEPPSKALLLTCRQISAEVKHMYRQAYREFWSETKFHVDLSDDGRKEWQATMLAGFVRHAKADDIPHIRNLRFRPNYPSHYWLADGLWYNGPFCNWEGRVIEPGHITHWKAFATQPGVLPVYTGVGGGDVEDSEDEDKEGGEAEDVEGSEDEDVEGDEPEDVEDTQKHNRLSKDEVVLITQWFINYS